MPSPGIVTRQANPILYRAGLDKNFRDGYQFFEKQYPFYLKVSTVDRPEIEMATLTGPNRLDRIGEREAPRFTAVETGYKAAAVEREFGGGYAVTRKAIDDDLYGVVNKGAKWLGESAYFTYEYQSAALLNDAFAGSTFLAQDGLALCHTAHTLLGSDTTVANEPTTPVGFSLAGVTALMQLANRMKNQNGDPIQVTLNKAIIPNTQSVIQAAWKIFNQNAEPFTANNDENAIKGQLGNVQMQINRYMTSESNYFMIDDRLNDAHMKMRKALEVSDDMDWLTRTLRVAAYTRFMIFVYDPRGWYGAAAS